MSAESTNRAILEVYAEMYAGRLRYILPSTAALRNTNSITVTIVPSQTQWEKVLAEVATWGVQQGSTDKVLKVYTHERLNVEVIRAGV